MSQVSKLSTYSIHTLKWCHAINSTALCLNNLFELIVCIVPVTCNSFGPRYSTSECDDGGTE